MDVIEEMLQNITSKWQWVWKLKMKTGMGTFGNIIEQKNK